MFNGSEHFNDDYFQALERVGATDLNGTTNEDRTNYFQNVPVSALDTVLWLESDRMGHLLGAINKEKLDEQRGVVQNEKRQGENEPYSLSEELITKAVFPASHPYSHTVIGSMEDLNAALLDDVKEWFKTYYGAANATLAIAGDITAAEAKKKVEHFFGDIPAGPPIAKHDVWIAKRTGVHRGSVQDRVPQARIYKVWNTPQGLTPEDAQLDLLASVLASGKTSRLYKRLVYDDQSATDVAAFQATAEIGGTFTIRATAKPGVELKAVEKGIDEELAKLLAEGPRPDEVERARTEDIAGFIRGVERIGGFGGKSEVLAESAVYGGSPDAWKQNLRWTLTATPADLQRVARKWLGDGDWTLQVLPYPTYVVDATGVDRKVVPMPDSFP
ncbi:MAG: M16 family metallopeptidase, partial [Burkholderiales bacterium]